MAKKTEVTRDGSGWFVADTDYDRVKRRADGGLIYKVALQNLSLARPPETDTPLNW